MALVNYLSGGESANASKLNTLFDEFDRKLTIALDGKSLLFWNRQGVINGAFPGKQFMGPKFFFLSGTCPLFKYIFANDEALDGTRTPAQRTYDHSLFADYVDAADFYLPGDANHEDEANSIRYLDSNANDWTVWQSIGREYDNQNNNKYLNKSPLDWSLEAHKKTGDGKDWNLICRTADVEKLHLSLRLAQVELIFEGIQTFTFPKEYNHFNHFRIHNLSETSLALTFEDGPTINVPSCGSRCVRREGGTYTQGNNHFQKFLSGDPRYWNLLDASSPFVGIPDGSCYSSNAITNPSIIMTMIEQLGIGEGSPLAAPVVFMDESKFWNPELIWCPDHYSLVANDTKLGDLLIHKGQIYSVQSDESSSGDDATTTTIIKATFSGLASLSSLGTALGFSVSNTSEGKVLSDTSGKVNDLVSVTSNLITQSGNGRRVQALRAMAWDAASVREVGRVFQGDDGDLFMSLESPNAGPPETNGYWLHVSTPEILIPKFRPSGPYGNHLNGNRSATLPHFITNDSEVLIPTVRPYETINGSPVFSGPQEYDTTETQLLSQTNSTRTPKDNLNIFEMDVAEILRLNFLGEASFDGTNQNGEWTQSASREIRHSAFGPMLIYTREDNFASRPHPSRIIHRGTSWLDGTTLKTRTPFYLGEAYGFPIWYRGANSNFTLDNRHFQSCRAPAYYGINGGDGANTGLAWKNHQVNTPGFVFKDVNKKKPGVVSAERHVEFKDETYEEMSTRTAEPFRLMGVNGETNKVHETHIGLADWLSGRGNAFGGSTQSKEWYVSNRARILLETTQMYFDGPGFVPDPADYSDGISWSPTIFGVQINQRFATYYQALSVEHYNALASLVNGIVRAVPVNFGSFWQFGCNFTDLLTIDGSGWNYDTRKFFPSDYYRFVIKVDEVTNPLEEMLPQYSTFWAANGIAPKTIDDVMVNYDGEATPVTQPIPQRFSGIGTASINVYSLLPRTAANAGAPPPGEFDDPNPPDPTQNETGELRWQMAADTFTHVEDEPFDFHTDENYQWISIDQAREFADRYGLKLIIARASKPCDIEIQTTSEIEAHAKLNTELHPTKESFFHPPSGRGSVFWSGYDEIHVVDTVPTEEHPVPSRIALQTQGGLMLQKKPLQSYHVTAPFNRPAKLRYAQGVTSTADYDWRLVTAEVYRNEGGDYHWIVSEEESQALQFTFDDTLFCFPLLPDSFLKWELGDWDSFGALNGRAQPSRFPFQEPQELIAVECYGCKATVIKHPRPLVTFPEHYQWGDLAAYLAFDYLGNQIIPATINDVEGNVEIEEGEDEEMQVTSESAHEVTIYFDATVSLET